MMTPILTHPTPNTQAVTRVPRPAARVYPAWSMCCNCGGEYYPEDIPTALRDCGQYGTCGDCRAEATSEMAAWAAGVAL